MNPEPTDQPTIGSTPDNQQSHLGRNLLVMVVLFTPGACAAHGSNTREMDLAVTSTFLGSAVAAVICGILVAAPKRRPALERAILAVALAVGFYFVSIALCLCGCAFGGH